MGIADDRRPNIHAPRTYYLSFYLSNYRAFSGQTFLYCNIRPHPPSSHSSTFKTDIGSASGSLPSLRLTASPHVTRGLIYASSGGSICGSAAITATRNPSSCPPVEAERRGTGPQAPLDEGGGRRIQAI